MTPEALVQRWLHANRAHDTAQLNAPTGTAPAPPDLHALASRELAIPGRYQLSGPPSVPYVEPWWVRGLRWLHDRWDALWRALFGHVHVSGRTANTIGDAILVAAGLMLIYAAYVVLRNVTRARSIARLRAEPLAIPPDPQVLYRRACDAANAGEYGAAALLLFAATVALLDRRGAVVRSESATVGDLRRALRSENAALVPQFDAIAAPFVERAYAERSVGASQWQQAQYAFITLSSP